MILVIVDKEISSPIGTAPLLVVQAGGVRYDSGEVWFPWKLIKRMCIF